MLLDALRGLTRSGWRWLRPGSVRGSAVVTTPFSFFASVSAILRAGATAILADIDPATFNLVAGCRGGCSGRCAGQASRRHSAGTPLRATRRWDAFARLGHERSLKLIEDAAQAWGAEWHGVKAGALGDMAAFSFYPTKNLSAAGDAGMVTTNSDDWPSGPDAAPARHAPPLLSRRDGLERAHGRLSGRHSRVKLQYIDGWTKARRTVAQRYHALFHAAGLAEAGAYPSHGIVLPHEFRAARHVWHQYVIRTRAARRAARLPRHAQDWREIYYPVPLHLQTALKSLGYSEGDFPEAERAAREVLALPIFPELREDEQETVVNAIAEFLS